MTATLAPDQGPVTSFTFPIEKMEQEGDTLYVYGKATTPEVDSDEQVVDKDWSGEALEKWFATGPNVRVQHNPQRDPAGSGVKVEIDRDGDGAHWVKAAIDEPNAQLLVRKGHLRAFSVGIAKPLIVRDTTGKARNGIIKGGELAEISLVDRPANRSCYMEIAKAASDGSCELVGKVHGADLLTKAADTVNVDVPKSAQITFSPGDLAKLLKHRSAAEDREDGAFKAAADAETAVLGKDHREFSADDRKRLSGSGNALPDGSYPIPDKDALRRAAILARSGHGDVGAARKLIARRAKELGVANPLDEDDAKKADDVDAAKSAPAEVAAPAAVAKDGAPQLHHNDGDDDDTDSDADAMDKAAAPEKAAAPDMAKKPKIPCPKCKGMNKAKAKFCGKCGAPMMAAKSATPGDGVTGEHTEAAPPHREPDGPAIEALEHDAGMPTVPDSSVKTDEAEVLAVAARHKALGVDSEMGMLHDLTCAAFDPAAVAKSYPGVDFSAISVASWLDKTLSAATTGALEQAQEAGKLVETAVTLKAVAPDLAEELRHEAFKAFKDANPGPGKAPTPGELSAERFNRPLITAGHSAPSPGQDAPHTSPIHPQHIAAADFGRDLITAGHAADSPDNDPGHALPMAPEVPGVPSRVDYTKMQRDNAAQAMSSMHDHIAATFPDLCPMAGPGRMGEPPSHARPVPVGVGGPAPHGATKTAEPDAVADFEEAAAVARAARKAARKQRLDLLDAIIGGMSINTARAELGLEPLPEPVTKAASVEGEVVTLEAGFAPDLIKSAIAEAQTPLLERLDAQQKLLDAMADQPDPRVAAYRGVAYNQTPAPPAGLLNSPDQRPAGVPDVAYKAMYDQWRNSPDPELRENALKFLMERTGLTQNARA